MGRYAKITGAGQYNPERLITNEEIDEMFGAGTGDMIFNYVGAKTRHVMSDDENTSDLAVKAAQTAIKNANISAVVIWIVRFPCKNSSVKKT